MSVGFWTFAVVYLAGTGLGVLANQVLNVQLRRPALSKSIALGVLGLLLAVFIATHNSTMPEWLLMLLWAGIGLLAGLGSRPARFPL
jgi:hypothetical protein